MERRSFLKRAGIVGATASALGGAGFATLSGSAAASSVSISASAPSTVVNDRGDLSEVTVDPQFSVQWEDLDDAVAKVFYVIEAKVGDGDFWPIFRATPWLPASEEINSYVTMKPGTTGEYTLKQPHSVVLNQDSRFSDGEGPDISASPLIVADSQGRPVYSDLNFPGGVDIKSFLAGDSIGGASDYPGAHEDGGLQNNYHDIDAGYYGAASDTAPFDNGADGTTSKTNVTLRYTFELRRPDIGWAESRTGLSRNDDESDDEYKQRLADELDGIHPSDIASGNSPIVMSNEDGNSNPDDTRLTYAEMRNYADGHVGLMTDTASFGVSVRNEGASSSASGDSNTGAN